MTRTITSFVVGWVLWGLMSGCQSPRGPVGGSGTVGAKGTPLRVGVTPGLAPLVFKEAGNWTGFEADMARALGEELGRPIKFVEVSWDKQLDALLEGRTDLVMSGLCLTPERQVRVAFSQSYLKSGQMVLVRREDGYKYNLGVPKHPEGTIGVVAGSTGGYFAQDYFARNKFATHATPQEAVSALLHKHINVFLCDAPIAWWTAAQNEGKNLVLVPNLLTDESMAWAVRKNDPDLLAAVNAFLLKAQNSGRLAETGKRWLPR